MFFIEIFANLYTCEIAISFISGWTVFRSPSTPRSNFTFSALPLQIASDSEILCDVDYPRSPIT